MYKKQPLLQEIERIEQEGRSGCLKLSHDDQEVVFHFREGALEAVSSNLPEHRLGQYLLRAELLDSEKLNKLLRRSRRKERALGETAVQAKVLDASELTRLIQAQAFALLRICLGNGFTISSFESPSSSFHFSSPINPYLLVLELARDNSKALTLGSSGLFRLRRDQEISLMPWSPLELSILSHLNIPKSLGNLTSETGIPSSQVQKILEVFHELGFIEVCDEMPSDTASLVEEEGLSLEVLIPEIRNSTPDDKLEVLKNKSSFVSEQFSSLKVQIEGMAVERPIQVISVCGAYTKDGKSLVASNLGMSYAQDPGRRVLLLDCDLRNPNIQKYLGIPLEPGIINYLTDEGLEPYCYIRRVGRLFVMTAGGITDNAVELLSHPKMGELMDYLRKEFDTVVLDSAPLDLVSDARILFRLVDGIVMVIRRAKTPFGSVERAFKALDPDKLLGVVFNDVKPQRFHTYSQYGYYHYGKGQYPYYSGKGRDNK